MIYNHEKWIREEEKRVYMLVYISPLDKLNNLYDKFAIQ